MNKYWFESGLGLQLFETVSVNNISYFNFLLDKFLIKHNNKLRKIQSTINEFYYHYHKTNQSLQPCRLQKLKHLRFLSTIYSLEFLILSADMFIDIDVYNPYIGFYHSLIQPLIDDLNKQWISLLKNDSNINFVDENQLAYCC